MNYLIHAAAAVVPLIVGWLWYRPNVFGNAWMNSIGMTEEKASGGNMPLIFGLSLVLAFVLTLPLAFFVNHPAGPGDAPASFDTFQHGMLHGALVGFLFALPLIATKAIFEQRSFKYVAINTGYWIVTLALMGGILDQWLPTIVYN